MCHVKLHFDPRKKNTKISVSVSSFFADVRVVLERTNQCARYFAFERCMTKRIMANEFFVCFCFHANFLFCSPIQREWRTKFASKSSHFMLKKVVSSPFNRALQQSSKHSHIHSIVVVLLLLVLHYNNNSKFGHSNEIYNTLHIPIHWHDMNLPFHLFSFSLRVGYRCANNNT